MHIKTAAALSLVPVLDSLRVTAVSRELFLSAGSYFTETVLLQRRTILISINSCFHAAQAMGANA